MGNQIPGWLSAWLPNILLGPAGAIILLRKARSSGRSFQFSIPAVGGSYVDPQFGATINRVTSAGVFVSYSAITAFNADDSLVFGTDTSGNVNVYPRAGGAATYSAVPVNGEAYVAWDPIDPNKMVFYQNATIKSRNLSGATTTTRRGSLPARAALDALRRSRTTRRGTSAR